MAGTMLGASAPVRGAAGNGSGAAGRAPDAVAEERPRFDPAAWGSVRAQFPLAEDEIDLSAMYISSHPWPVRDAIADHARALDRRPTRHLIEANDRLTARSLHAAAAYLGGRAADVALVDSTTMGIGLLYSGIDLSAGQEALTTEHDYYVTHESLRLATEGSGARVRTISLYEDHPGGLAPDQVVEAVAGAVGPATRVVGLTWVHSGTGLKLPLRKIAARIRRDTADRADSDRPILCVDGVHGFAVEDVDVAELGFDFFVAGCHKWLFGPRGTGIVWGDGEAWRWVRPSTPSFLANEPWRAWFEDRAPRGRSTGARFSGGRAAVVGVTIR